MLKQLKPKSSKMPDRFPDLPRSRKISVSLSEVLAMAIESLWSNRLRTALTMLGVIIGIASVISITSVGQGVQKSTEQQIQALGSNLLLVTSGASRTGGISSGGGSASTLTWEDAKAIAKQVPAVEGTTAFLQRQTQIVYGGQNTSTTTLGTDLNLSTIRNISPQEGRFFNQEELDTAAAVVVLGSKVRDDLFGNGGRSVGEDIRIQGNRYRVIGVMEPKGNTGGQDQDDRVYIPLKNMSARIVGNNSLSGISISGVWLKSADEERLDEAQFQVTNLLRLRHNIRPPQLDDFRITNQADILNTFTSIVGLFTIMIGAIAGISLLVGGIGIANIMLVSVVERTREIGIRKAVGATKRAILNQFLTEAVIVSCFGGTIGIVFGIAIAFGAATIFSFPFIVSGLSVVVAFGLSMLVGLIAGVVPARNAAQLDPINALRSD
ncbi:ABC transporter permease [Tumidithrix elongata RA019]|uniref:ABC transporter permease n=2 Tax=Tumidithrix TaxID=3088355 RepID=A0AAW9PU63_9CYAN|nr:ABC transporter permease [Tumidithrix elongata RA019]